MKKYINFYMGDGGGLYYREMQVGCNSPSLGILGRVAVTTEREREKEKEKIYIYVKSVLKRVMLPREKSF